MRIFITWAWLWLNSAGEPCLQGLVKSKLDHDPVNWASKVTPLQRANTKTYNSSHFDWNVNSNAIAVLKGSVTIAWIWYRVFLSDFWGRYHDVYFQYFCCYSSPSVHTQNPFRKWVLFPSSEERRDLICSYFGSSPSQTLFGKKHDLLFYWEYMVQRTHKLSCLNSEVMHYRQT